MRMFALLSLMPLVAVAGSLPRVEAAPIPKHLVKEPKNDKEKFQGKWKVESITMDGRDVLAELNQPGQNPGVVMDFGFDGDQLLINAKLLGVERTITATVKFDAGGTRRLTTTNRRINTGGRQTEKSEGEDIEGYAFDGEKLLLGPNIAGLFVIDRKKAIDPLKPGKGEAVLVLVRVK